MIDHQARSRGWEERVVAAAAVSGPTSQKQVGRGRVFYIPGLQFDGPMPSSEPYFSIDKAFWKRPANWKQLVDGIEWTSRGSLPLKVSGPDYLVANLVEQPQRHRQFIHLVNFNVKNVPSIENVEISVAGSMGNAIHAIRAYSLESETGTDLTFRMNGDSASFVVPRLNAYCMIEVS